MTKGLEKVLDTSQKLLGRRPHGRIVVPTNLSCFTTSARVYNTREQRERARAVFEDVGRLALNDRRELKGENWINRSCLGYGNSGGLTVFYYNTPTTTLTALWKENEEVTHRWKALFPRRPRMG